MDIFSIKETMKYILTILFSTGLLFGQAKINGSTVKITGVPPNSLSNACISSTGTDAFTCDVSSQLTYTNGISVLFRPTAASCEGPATINMSTKGIKKLFGPDGTSDPVCMEDRNYLLTYDSTLDSAAGAWSIVSERIYQTKTLLVTEFSTNNSTGDGKAYFPVPPELNGTILYGISARVINAGTTGTMEIQAARCAAVTSGNTCSSTVDDMLSTKLTIDSGENFSVNATTPAVINTTYDDLSYGQVIRIDIDAVHTTPAKGLIVLLTVASADI